MGRVGRASQLHVVVHAEAEAEAGEDTAGTKRSLGLRVSGGPFGRHEANAARRASCGGAAAVSLTVRMIEAQCRDVPASWRRSVCLLCGPTHSAESSAAETRRGPTSATQHAWELEDRNYLRTHFAASRGARGCRRARMPLRARDFRPQVSTRPGGSRGTRREGRAAQQAAGRAKNAAPKNSVPTNAQSDAT